MINRRKPGQSIADYARAHRVAFVRALAEGITPQEAADRIEAEQARLKWHARQQRLEARHRGGASGSPPASPASPASSDRDEGWMMRN